MAESYSVEAYLKAVGADQFTSAFKNATKNVEGLDRATESTGLTIGKLAAAVGITAAVAKGFQMVKSAVDGAVSRYDTLSGFPKVLEQMGFSAKDSEKAMSKLSDGIQGLPTTLDDVAKNTQRIATLTGDLDGATDTTLALNNAFIASGSSSADASRGLEQYVQMLSRGEVDLAAWRTLQETMGVALNDVAKAFGFAGASAQNDLYDALKSGEITFNEFNAKLIELDGGVNGFAERARTSSGGIRTAFTNMKTSLVRGVTEILKSIDGVLKNTSLKSIENVIQQAGSKFFGFLNAIAVGIPPAVQKIKEVYAALEPWLPAILSIVAGIATFVVVVSVINTVKNAFMSLKLAVLAVNTAVLANPFVAVLAIIIAVALLVYTYWEPISEFFSNLWQYILDVFRAAYTFLNDITGGAFGEYISIIQTALTTAWTIIQAIWEYIKSTFLNTLAFLKALVTGDFDGMKEAMRKQMDNAKNLLTTIWELIKSKFGAKMAEILANVIAKFVEIKSNIQSKMTEAKTALVNKLAEMVSNTIAKGANIVSAIRTAFTNFVSAVKEKATEAVLTLAQKVGEMPGKVAEKAGEMVSAGKNLVRGLVNGIKGMAGSAVEAITGVVDGVVSKAKSLLKIKSPSRVFKEIGAFTGEGMAIGITDSIRDVSRASQRLATASIPTIEPIDIGSQVATMNQRAERQLNHTFNSNLYSEKRVEINLSIGGRDYTRFVQDIKREQEFIDGRDNRY